MTQREADFCISAITHYEIGIGSKKSNNDFWTLLYKNLTVIPFNQACSSTAINIYLDLKKKNKLIDIADLFIGATALAYNFKLATLNQKHFLRIGGLEIIEYARR